MTGAATWTEPGSPPLAFGPIVHGSHVDGGVVIGTRDPVFARSLVERWASLIDFSTTPSALLAERLHARQMEIALRRSITDILERQSFRPVFQPIVELATGDIVGHEALTRFESEERPDRVFADAWTVGLGPDLELATLVSAIEAAHRLPPGTWLDLNISPRLLLEATSLRSVLRAADRPIVLEVTEHEIVDDYVGFLKAVRTLGHDIRLAVDDAGAGVANFGHIIDLKPDFVKLDLSLVRRVNAHLGRQALDRWDAPLLKDIGLSPGRRRDPDRVGGANARHARRRVRAGLLVREPDSRRLGRDRLASAGGLDLVRARRPRATSARISGA